jgi:hypothetical protein
LLDISSVTSFLTEDLNSNDEVFYRIDKEGFRKKRRRDMKCAKKKAKMGNKKCILHFEKMKKKKLEREKKKK